MPKLRLLTFLGVFLSLAPAQELDVTATFNSDYMRSKEYTQKVVGAVNDSGGFKGEVVMERLTQALQTESIEISQPTPPEAPFDLFQYGRDRSYVIARPGYSSKTESWYLKTATAWAMTEDGVFMTNYHVLERGLDEGGAVLNFDLECFPITDILIADKASDFVVFKVALPEGRKIKAFTLGESERVGSELYLVSHPVFNYFYFSRGPLARYTMHQGYQAEEMDSKILWMNTEVGYCQGSSGGGFYNKAGEVVGMVSFIKPNFDVVVLDSDKDKYARKIFEYTVPVKNMRNRIKIASSDLEAEVEDETTEALEEAKDTE